MSIPPSVPPTPPPSPATSHSCCCTTGKNANRLPWDRIPPSVIKTVEVITRIGLAAFACYLDWQTFVISFSVGLAVGVAYALTEKHYLKTVSMGNSKPVCAQGYMEYLSDTRWHTVIATIMTAVFIADHMDHRPGFYVPFVGFFVGFWVGKLAVHEGTSLAKRAKVWIDEQIAARKAKQFTQATV